MSSNDCEIFRPLWQYSLDSKVWAASGQAYFWDKEIRKIKILNLIIRLIKISFHLLKAITYLPMFSFVIIFNMVKIG